MVEIKNDGELAVMREAGRIVARLLSEVREAAAPDVRLRDLDELAAQVMADSDAKPSFLGYLPHFASTPYPAVLCTSVNDAVVHSIPSDYRLQDGDLLSVDCAVHVDGWHGDAAVSFVVGTADPADLALIEMTERALAAGIDALRPGNRLGDVSHAIAEVGRAAGYGLLADHGGHGIGRAMHEDPIVPNDGRAGRGLRLRPGMTFALEPMLLAGGADGYRYAADGWAVHAADGSRAAHAEHTVVVTDDGPRVLTVS